jgi:glycosyltransferase involved in cell wall biosynthesis
MNSIPRGLVVSYSFGLADPTTRNTAASMAERGYRVALLGGDRGSMPEVALPGGVESWTWRAGGRLPWAAASVARWFAFRHAIARAVDEFRPDLVVAVMHHAVAGLPTRGRFHRVACIYDIPSMEDAGRLDRWIIRAAWRRLSRFDLVWSSDPLKAELTRKMGALTEAPVVCHNAPVRRPLAAQQWPRDGRLRAKLIEAGAPLRSGGLVLLRAGAIGEHCGIEATLEALQHLPEDHVFLMMGRPSADYAGRLRRKIDEMGLHRRALLWERPDDATWNDALSGSDLGHLIHGPHPPGPGSRAYALNSSLSNNRLFSYMAAGLPIVSYDDPRLSSLHAEIDCFRVARLSSLAGDLETILRELGGDPATRRRMGEVARHAHESRYHWEQEFGAVLSALERKGILA